MIQDSRRNPQIRVYQGEKWDTPEYHRRPIVHKTLAALKYALDFGAEHLPLNPCFW